MRVWSGPQGQSHPIDTARQLVDRHGARAAAVVAEYVAEAQLAGDPAALHRARQAQSAVDAWRSFQRRAAGLPRHLA